MPETAVWAHRGSPGEDRRDNTLAAFLEALRLGADGLELDARLTADGVVVVLHDPAPPGAPAVCKLASRQLPAWLPTLEEVLDATGDAFLNVELKDLPGEPGWRQEEPLATSVAGLLRGHEQRSAVSSFYPPALAAATVVVPSLRAGWLLPPGRLAGGALDEASRLGLWALHPHHSLVDDQLLTWARGRGLAVNTWTVNDAGTVARLAAAGVDAVITDDVRAALGAVGREKR